MENQIQFEQMDITTVTRGIVAHGVNCQRVMGSGVALAIRNKWPLAYDRYMEQPSGQDMLKTTHVISVADDLFVANCYTQVNFGADGKRYADLDAVEKCLDDVFKHASLYGLPVYLPKIASDRGGLDWDTEVLPVLEFIFNRYSGEVECTVCVFP